jgi:hypothetical protein
MIFTFRPGRRLVPGLPAFRCGGCIPVTAYRYTILCYDRLVSLPLLSEAVLAFIRKQVDSIDQLEILLLLKHDPEQEWTPNGLRHYRYFPRTPSIHATIQEVEIAYRTYSVPVINLIYAKPLEKIWTFADAFKLRKGSK